MIQWSTFNFHHEINLHDRMEHIQLPSPEIFFSLQLSENKKKIKKNVSFFQCLLCVFKVQVNHTFENGFPKGIPNLSVFLNPFLCEGDVHGGLTVSQKFM